MAIVFARPALVRFNGTPVTDHNRSALQIALEPVEKFVRTWNGTGRLQHIADKRTFSMSWEMLPGATIRTADGFMGADAIETFYDTTKVFTLGIVERDATVSDHLVRFSDFSKEFTKRWQNDNYYSVSVTLEEL